MEISSLFRRFLAFSVFVLFFSMIFVSAVGVSVSPSPTNPGSTNAPIPHLEGIGGSNNWFISDVLISFSFDPEQVKEIGYNLDGSWHEYNNPFTVDDEGNIQILWYWIDKSDVQHNELPVVFKIDKSKPTISIDKQIGLNKKVTFTVTCNDDVSDVEYVEFYLDDDLVSTTTETYEFVWTPDGSGAHDVYAIGYNYAGLSEISETLDTKEKSRSLDLSFFSSFFQQLFQIIYLIQQIILN